MNTDHIGKDMYWCRRDLLRWFDCDSNYTNTPRKTFQLVPTWQPIESSNMVRSYHTARMGRWRNDSRYAKYTAIFTMETVRLGSQEVAGHEHKRSKKLQLQFKRAVILHSAWPGVRRPLLFAASSTCWAQNYLLLCSCERPLRRKTPASHLRQMWARLIVDAFAKKGALPEALFEVLRPTWRHPTLEWRHLHRWESDHSETENWDLWILHSWSLTRTAHFDLLGELRLAPGENATWLSKSA